MNDTIGWIKVKDELPDVKLGFVSDWVLVLLNAGELRVAMYHHEKKEWLLGGSNIVPLDAVSLWQPRPAIPNDTEIREMPL